MTTHASNLQLLNNTEHRLKFKTGSDINNTLINYPTTHSLSFNGTDQHGVISDLEINGAFTISMWVKLRDHQSGVTVYPLFLKDYVSTGTTDIFLDLGNGRLRASVYDRTGPWSTQISCQMGEFLSNDTWHHIMMTYDGTVNDSAIRTFMNGVESITNVIRSIDNTGSFNSVNSPADTDAYIGWGSLNNRRFKGEMDQIAIWHSDQSSNISSIYRGDGPADLTSLSPDHLFELNNSTDNSTGTSTFTLYGGGEFKPKYIYATPRYSAQVDGVDDQIGIGYDSMGNLRGDGNMLGITGNSHTFCFWIKPLDPANSTGRFVYNSKIQIELRTDGFRFYTPGINKQHIHTVTPDTWYFLALSCDGTSHTSYVKSVSDDISATVEGQSFTTINSGYVTFGPAVKARYDEIATFNSALSASEIDRIYKYGIKGSTFLSLAGYWRMGDSNQGTGIIISDELGGEDGQLRNGAFFSNDTAPLPGPTLKDPLVGELLLEKNGELNRVDFDGKTRLDTNYTYNGSGEITVSAWVKITQTGQFIIATDSQTGGSESRFAFGLKNANYYVLLGASGNKQTSHLSPISSPIADTNSNRLVDDGQWHNLVYRVDSSNETTVWLDGVLEATYQTNFTIDNSIHVTSYGAGWSDGTEPLYDTWGFNGQLQGLGVWETALTDQQINSISMSGPNSSAPYSPNVWVGPAGPALYSCTDTSGTISKVSGNLAKMGNVQMLKLNEQQFVDSGNLVPVSDFAYSFWFYDDGIGTGSHYLVANSSAGNNGIQVLHDSSQLNLQSHGVFDDTCHPTNHGPNCAHFLDSSIATSNHINLLVNYEKHKLNHLLVVKKGGTIYPSHNTGSCWVYINGKLAGSIIEAAYHTYPSTYCLQKFNPLNAASEMMIGDAAYWNQDVTSVIDEILDPIGGHKGHQGNLMDMSIKPRHYWKFGSPMVGGQVQDIGTDGTNHHTPNSGIQNIYEYKNIFGVERT